MPYTCVYLDGEEETSEWVSRAGRARVTYDNGDVFEGSFNSNGKKHGKGKYTWAAPEDDEAKEEPVPHFFDGNYVEGEREGLGLMHYPDGSKYHGNWASNLRHGQGAYTFSNGDIYSGEWKHGSRSGEGTYLYAASDASLVGDWRSGEIGTGKFVSAGGCATYTGSFSGGKPIGKGTYSFNRSNITQEGEFIERIVESTSDKLSTGETQLVWTTA